ELLVDAVTDYAIYLVDRDGVIRTWNAGAERIKGYRAAEVIGQHFSLFFTPEDKAADLPGKILEGAARTGRAEQEGWRIRKGGGRFWAGSVVQPVHDARGRAVGFAKITRDMTEQREAQQALYESERRFRLLVQAVKDCAIYMLDPSGIIVNWNSGAERLKGYLAAEIVGQHFSKFYTREDRMAGLPVRVLETTRREGHYEGEGWRLRKDGSLFWANAIIDRITDEHGALIGLAKITRDITERRNAQLGLQQAQAQRAQAQKMEALGQLTGGVAHDFNNLLMIVGGHLQSLKKLVAGDEKGGRAIEAIELAAKRGATLTRQLLTFSRRQTFHPTMSNLSERIDAFRNMLTTSLGASARLVTDIPGETWPVLIDTSEFELALVNLALNARDALPAQDGVITVSAENVQLTPQQTPAHLQGEFVALSVADNGSGIAPDILPLVFAPFFTTKGPSKGSGLGLSQVYG